MFVSLPNLRFLPPLRNSRFELHLHHHTAICVSCQAGEEMKEVEELEEAEEVKKAEEQPQSKEPARSLDFAPFDRLRARRQAPALQRRGLDLAAADAPRAAARRAGRLTKMRNGDATRIGRRVPIS